MYTHIYIINKKNYIHLYYICLAIICRPGSSRERQPGLFHESVLVGRKLIYRRRRRLRDRGCAAGVHRAHGHRALTSGGRNRPPWAPKNGWFLRGLSMVYG